MLPSSSTAATPPVTNSSTFVHPWDSFLSKISDDSPVHSSVNPRADPPMKPNSHLVKSYIAAVTGDELSNHTYPPTDSINPVRKGDYFSVKIDDALYKKRVQQCESSLIGRLILAKGDKPWTFEDLRARLQGIWTPVAPWRIISLGKGYYNLLFSSESDKCRVWDKGSWMLKPGVLRLQRWIPDFNPYKIKTSIAQVWIRIYELSVEYWDPSIILGIAKAVGTPIKLDNHSITGSYGHYARVLVEVDLAMPLQEQVMLERTGFCTFVSISYERLPEYCPNCLMVGHSAASCKRGRKSDFSEINKEDNGDKIRSKEKFMYRRKDNSKTIAGSPAAVEVAPTIPTTTTNRFELLSEEVVGKEIVNPNKNFQPQVDDGNSQTQMNLDEQVDDLNSHAQKHFTELVVVSETDVSSNKTKHTSHMLQIRDAQAHNTLITEGISNAHIGADQPHGDIPSLLLRGSDTISMVSLEMDNDKFQALKQKLNDIRGSSSSAQQTEKTSSSDNSHFEQSSQLPPLDTALSDPICTPSEILSESNIEIEDVPQMEPRPQPDPSTDVLKQKIDEIRSSTINPPPIVVTSADENAAFNVMSIAARKSWADLMEEQNLQAQETQDSPKNPDTTDKDPTRKSTRNRRPAFKLRL